MKKMLKPEINPTFFYGPIISYKFTGDISKDRGKYRFRFTLTFKSGNEYPTQKSGFRTLNEARKAKELLITQLVKNEYIPFNYTVKEVFDYWLFYYMIEEGKIRYNTFQTYRNVLYNYLIKYLGEKKKIKSVTIEDLVEAVNSIPYSSTKEKAVYVIKKLFTFAVGKFISFNPSIAACNILKPSLPKEKRRDVSPYTINQIRYLLYMCKENFPELYLPLVLAFTTGTRVSETIGLRYSDIDFTSKELYIQRQLGRDIKDTGEKKLLTQPLKTKTPNGIRLVPLPDWVVHELLVKRAWYEKQKQRIPDFKDTDHIICHCNGTPYCRRSFLKDFHTLTSMCGLQYVDWHDIRHMYASTLKNNSVNMKAISEFLGHSTPDFTDEVYVHHEEIAYDCSMLEDFWEEVRPDNTKDNEICLLHIPFTNEDYASYFV